MPMTKATIKFPLSLTILKARLKTMDEPLPEPLKQSFIDRYGERTFNRIINEETLPKDTQLKGRDLFS